MAVCDFLKVSIARCALAAVTVSGMTLYVGTQASAQPMQIQVMNNTERCPACFIAIAYGEITPQTPEQFRELLGEPPSVIPQVAFRQVMLHSKGGDLKAGLELGRVFRQYNIQVMLVPNQKTGEPAECSSACAYAFLGSVDPDETILSDFVTSRPALGFHQFYDDRILSSTDRAEFTGYDRLREQAAVGMVINYLIEMGIKTDLYAAIADVPPGEMRFISEKEAFEFGIIDSFDAPEYHDDSLEEPEWDLVAYGSGIALEFAYDDRGQRFFCSTEDPGTIRMQFMHKTQDGSTVLSTQLGTGDVALAQQLYTTGHYVIYREVNEFEDDEEIIIQARFGGLYAAASDRFTFVVDFALRIEDFELMQPGDSIGIDFADNDGLFENIGYSNVVAAGDAVAGGIPPSTDWSIFEIMQANCI